ncbi:MAG: hypothetical protein ACRDRS_17720 [Pseudonocardiaceae bacterium]
MHDWLRERLVETYPLFQRRGGDADAAALVAARDKVALILDGLDEMDEALRPAALEALSEAPFRVVLLTRGPDEMSQAAREKWLVSAVAVQLHNVTGPEAADYLERSRTGPPPSGWQMFLTHLREHPDDPLASGLSTPLTLTLLRDTYDAGDDVDELLDPTRYSTAEHIERHLIGRVLPAAYKPRSGRPPPRYSEAKARQALTILALQMHWHNTRDLTLWQIPQWTSTTPSIYSTGLRYGLKRGLVYGLVYGAALGLALGVVLMLMSPLGFMSPRTGEFVVWGLVVGVVSGLVCGLMYGPIFGIMGALLGKFASVQLLAIYKLSQPRRIRVANWHAVISRQALRLELAGGLMGGLTFSLLPILFPRGLPGEFPGGHLGGLGIGFMFGFATSALGAWLAEGDADDSRPLGPQEILRSDRAACLLYGFFFGLAYGFVYAFAGGGLIWFICVAPISGVGVGLSTTQIFRITLAWHQLKIAGYVPAIKIMAFLEDACERDVLRTVGAVYQFRHATLQDQLVDQINDEANDQTNDRAAPNSAVSRVLSRIIHG